MSDDTKDLPKPHFQFPTDGDTDEIELNNEPPPPAWATVGRDGRYRFKDDEIDFDEVAGGVDLTRFSREEIRAMSAEDLRRLIKQGHEADKQREKRDQAQDEALAALIDALDDKEQQLRAEYEEQIGQIRKQRDEAKALVDYRGSSLKVNMPKWREGAGNHAILVLLLVVMLGGGGGVLLGANVGGGVHVNASAESNATVIQAETVEGILGERDGWLLLAPEDRAAFRAEGVDPYAEEGE